MGKKRKVEGGHTNKEGRGRILRRRSEERNEGKALDESQPQRDGRMTGRCTASWKSVASGAVVMLDDGLCCVFCLSMHLYCLRLFLISYPSNQPNSKGASTTQRTTFETNTAHCPLPTSTAYCYNRHATTTSTYIAVLDSSPFTCRPSIVLPPTAARCPASFVR